MKVIRKVFKRVLISISLLFTILILAGFVFRLLGPEPHQPMGKLVDLEGTKYHIYATGKRSNKPTLVIEGGAGSSTEYYHWLSEGLKDSMRVVRYDRAGVGYSEIGDTPHDAETIAKKLHTLLEITGESPPYILAGHSLGGPYIRVFAQRYPDEVAAMVFLDSTHPEQVERFNAAPESSFRFKSVIWSLNVATFFADVGFLGLLESIIGPIFPGEGLPDTINKRTQDILLNGKCLRGYRAELKNYHAILKRANEANEFGSIPIRVFTAIEMDKEAYKERGIDPKKHVTKLVNGQKEFTKLSTNGKQFLIDGNHQTIFTKKENADIICKEISLLLEELEN